jgi:S-adenosylmethionine-diacylglycerol 3-amino-3-carboxypropyl transferase
VRGKTLKTLFSFDDIHEQRLFVTQHWDNYWLRKLFETLINPKILKNVLNDPGLNSFVEYSKKPGHYIYQRMLDCLHQHLAKKSALFQLVFYGKLLPEAYFSYLTPAGYQAIRRDPGRIHYQTANIVEYLHNEKNQGIDCFSLSDIASYMPQAAFEKLLAGIKQAANPNARFCIREFMSKRTIPAEFAAYFKRDAELEAKLEKEETNFVYRFMTGEILTQPSSHTI